ncbi:ATP-binding protein [Streptomyces thermolineatus]|uniref:Nuclease SbcCD subunit C n=1 Tax=Streptomyces thermolineatus TaxID=44033 RepID=A0ABN3KSH9_9ACTN
MNPMNPTEQPEQEPHHHDRPAGAGRPVPVAELVETRLAEANLAEPVKDLLRKALGSGPSRQTSGTGRIYLDSVAVTGFRGIGRRSKLDLGPRPGVTLVVGRNGCGKSSFAEAVETAFTGTNGRRQGQGAARDSNWRNLHHGAEPKIEVKLAVEGETDPTTLVRTWKGDDFDDSTGELRRPGHGRVPAGNAPWAQDVTDYRPFLSYTDLDRMISGKPSQQYDAIAAILGLGDLTNAYDRLQKEEKRLKDITDAPKAELPALKDALEELENDDRAFDALVALETPGKPDLKTLEALVAGTPSGTDESLLARLRAEADAQCPDMAEVGEAVDRLNRAVEAVEEVRASTAEDARQRADLLSRALAHSERHPDEETCPVCGSDRALDAAWARRATTQIEKLRAEAKTADDAHVELKSAVRALKDLARSPRTIPPVLAEPWADWAACREIDNPRELARRTLEIAVTLSDACETVSRHARKELERLDERWSLLVPRLAGWTGKHRAAEEADPLRKDVGRACRWIKALREELRTQRMDGFADQAQRIWETLRQESDIDLKSVQLKGSERAAVRKLVMDVSVDGAEASALGVMSQGEQHSLALSLFLPRAATADSPFGFILVDDPVQSMDPAKVHGLAQVLHELGQHRQVVVFTHDTRLQRAFTSQELPVTVFQVHRHERSLVEAKPVTDPVRQALDDARALARTENLTEAARNHVLPGLCRIALENAFLEVAWTRHRRSGRPEHELQAAVSGADRLMKLAALALFDDPGSLDPRSLYDSVYRKLCSVSGNHAEGLVKKCQAGAHPGGARIDDAGRFVELVTGVVEKVRKSGAAA